VKFVNRIEEIVSGAAPAISSICRYNQRALPVLSYVAQFTPPPKAVKIKNLAMWGLHRIFRMPAQCMSYRLLHTTGFCTSVQSIPINAYCAAIHYRFAHSEREYLRELHRKVLVLTQDSLSRIGILSDSHRIPFGRLDSPCLLGSLLDALNLNGSLRDVNRIARTDPDMNWILNFPSIAFPSHFRGIQAAVLHVLSCGERVSCLQSELTHKTQVTLGPGSPICVRTRILWFSVLEPVLASVSNFLRFTWLKAVSGLGVLRPDSIMVVTGAAFMAAPTLLIASCIILSVPFFGNLFVRLRTFTNNPLMLIIGCAW
jgi:hypothetical protein